MELRCDECGSTKMEIDTAKGEAVCECGLVHNLPDNTADTNSSTSFGESQQHSAGMANTGDNGLGSKIDLNPTKDSSGNRLTAAQRRRARRLALYDRNTHREKDPMCRQLHAKVREMFGEDVARAARLLIEATARKLTPEQEATRRTLTKGEQKRLNLPKTSITRKQAGVKGSSDKQNLEIMALAIAIISKDWFRTVPINQKQIMEQYGISRAQIMNALKVIRAHYKARVGQGWAPEPRVMSLAASREADMDIALDNIVAVLEARLTTEQLDAVFKRFWGIMNAINEPSVDGPLANVAISIIVVCIIYAILQQLNLHVGNLNAIADAVGLGRSGAGVKNRIKTMKGLFEEGGLPEIADLFEDIHEYGEEEVGDEAEEAGE